MLSQKQFLREVDETIEVYEKCIGSFAVRTRQMIEREGYIKALSKLVCSSELQKGFKILRDCGKLEYSFEALTVKYSHFFSKGVVEAAKWRLDNRDILLDSN
ncbi:MAG: hypothetical protein OXH71_05125 [Candidatus Dadabacteria bacterium]|nr:hypothetical protein [Candidatus Dadabacteria bacterium]MDE0520057.1 hypothetical protein [Candidatus Dadabacteria bacterium]MDE0663877.1 hypothetical protein [Candidatus Dadabacteria bacterium]